jgi:hypothetical protein
MIFTTTVIKKLSLLLPFFGSATESTETDLETAGTGDMPVQQGLSILLGCLANNFALGRLLSFPSN